MYYILLDIYHLDQLRIIEPQVISNIDASLREIAQLHGMEEEENSHGYFFYNMRRESGDYMPVINCAFSIKESLVEYEEELPGYSLILEAENNDGYREFQLEKLVGMVRERNGIYLGPKAENLLSRFLIGERFYGLWKIIDRKERTDQDLGTANEFVNHNSILSRIIDQIEPWINGELPPGELRIYGDAYDGVHLLARMLLHRLFSADAFGKIAYIVIDNGDFYSALLRSIDVDEMDWVEKELAPGEAELFRRKRHSLFQYSARPDLMEYPSLGAEEPENDLLLALQMYFRAFSRWSENRGNSAAACVVFERSLEDQEREFLNSIIGDCRMHTSIFWILCGTADIMAGGGERLDGREVKLELYDHTAVAGAFEGNCAQSGSAEPAYLHSASGGKALPLYLFLLDCQYFSELRPEKLKNNSSLKSHEALVRRSIERLDEENRELLFILQSASTVMDRKNLEEFLILRGISLLRIRELVKNLQGLGLMYFDQVHTPVFNYLIPDLSLVYSDVRRQIHESLIQFILQKKLYRSLDYGMFALLSSLSRSAMMTRLCARLCIHKIQARQYAFVEKILPLLNNHKEGNHAQSLVRAYMDLEKDALEERRLVQEPLEHDYWFAEWNLLAAQYHTFKRNQNAALKASKSAIIAFQGLEDDYGLSLSNILFGYLLLRQRNHNDAVKYFSIAKRTIYSADKNLAAILADLLPSLSDFIEGKYSEVRKMLEGRDGLMAKLDCSGIDSWHIAVSFLLARTYFSLGLYEGSSSVLSQTLNYMRHQRYSEIIPIVQCWIARNMVYSGKIKLGMEVLDRFRERVEAGIFLAEAYILTGEFDYALETIRKPRSHVEEAFPIHGLLPWNSGFSWMEDLFVADAEEDGVLSNFAHGIEAYAMGMSGDIEESIQRFYWLNRQKKLPSSDPHLSMMLFWYSQILEKTNSREHEDRLTLLGRAVKALQERSSRIAEPSDKREFLKNVKWNRELLEKAKRNNLV